jgi:hypothetical protein
LPANHRACVSSAATTGREIDTLTTVCEIRY